MKSIKSNCRKVSCAFGCAAVIWLAGAFSAFAELIAPSDDAAANTAAAVGTTMPSLEALNAADLTAEVRLGGVNGSPFWNAFAWQFIYAPAFDFKPVDGAANYRFRLTDAQGREHVFCADSPQASLAPVWKDVAPGAARLEVTALDAGGNELGLVATNGFHRSAPFRPGAYPPAVCGYGTCAERALDWMFRSRWVNGWASGEVDKTYQLNCYPSKMVPATMLAMVEYAKRHPEDREKAMRIAEGAADWMMANSVKEPESMRGLPITYLDYYEETRHLGDVWNSKKIAHEKRDQVMMIYPASVGKAYLNLFRATGKRKYFEYARTIADRYLGLQRPDGSWALVMEFPSGREVSSNAAGETGICEFLDEMGAETGDVRYRQASDRAIPAMVRRIREFDWEGQFEDTAVQRVRYANLTKHIAADTMLYLLDRFPDGRYAKDAREALRFAEDQFVAWSHPWGRRWYTPGVIEQYNCRVTIDASYAKMIRFYLKMYEIERNPLDLAKARALGDAITRNQQPDGLIPTVFPNDPGRAGRHWLNCMLATVRALLALEDAETGKVVNVYANSFREGGWKLDVQFMDAMGSPYLLAHGLGSPVPDATATATVPEAGTWRVWVRSRKWVDGAGFFKVLIDGRPLAKTFGAASDKWDWEDGGEVELEKGSAKITLRDLDGFDGRCAGIVLVKGDGAPKGPLVVTDRAPAQDYDFDFVVVGGGLAGCCAAVAAARAGIRVALVQDRPVPGGNASGEVRVWSAGEIRYPLVNELRGKFMNKDAGNALSDQDRIAILEREPNLSCFYWHRAFGVEKRGDGIAAVNALDVRGNRVVRFRAPLFCDATGDGWVGYWAGADWRSGREARGETGERYAPEKADRMTLGSSIMWDSAEGTYDIPFSAPWAEPYACGQSMTTGRWNWEFGLTDDVCENGEDVRDRILLAIYGTFSNAKKDPRNAHRRLVTCPFVLGKRESRRLMGDYIFCEQDVTEKRQFEDAVATGSWSIDLHYTIDEKVPFLTRCEQGYFGRYWIPYRTLYSRNVTNLFMAGRCFSCTHVGLGSPRVMNTLSQMGCVVGEAAAMCRRGGYSPRGLYSGGHVRELQRRLGGAFPGVPDPKEKGWLIVDDEDKSVSFEGDWYYSWNCNGGAVGLRSHFALKRNAKAVYPLPVKQKGRYLLKGRVPHLFTTSAVTPARLTIYSGGKTTEIVWNQLPESGTWCDLGTVDLEPGATLEMTAAVEGQPLNGKDEIDSFVADGFALFAVGCDSFNAREYAQRPLKVLMIGNSFSICVLRQMPAVADSMGLKLDLASMHIGGCSLERHWTNLVASVNADFKPYVFARCASAPRCPCLATSLESDT